MFTVDKSLTKKCDDKTIDAVLFVKGNPEAQQKIITTKKNSIEQKIKIEPEESCQENSFLFEVF